MLPGLVSGSVCLTAVGRADGKHCLTHTHSSSKGVQYTLSPPDVTHCFFKQNKCNVSQNTDIKHSVFYFGLFQTPSNLNKNKLKKSSKSLSPKPGLSQV